jgi:predicted lipoprotein with Yx(FWY)xxD motif
MPAFSNRASNRRRLTRLGTLVSTASLAVAPLVVVQGTGSASSTPAIHAANIPNYSGVLENHASRTLYLLSIEKGAKLHCVAKTCRTQWLPLLVPTATRSIAVAGTVKGKIGFVARSKTQKQVTVNTYPVYAFKGDKGPNQSNGEAVAADGGTWSMLRAAAKSAAATPVAPLLQSGTAGKYTSVLEDATHLTLYALSVEKGGTLHCTGSCLTFWPPLLVTSSTTSIAVAGDVKGKIGFISRGSSKQVTVNSFPVYTYSGDSGPNQSNGENLMLDGGTWDLASATATTAAGTQIPPK